MILPLLCRQLCPVVRRNHAPRLSISIYMLYVYNIHMYKYKNISVYILIVEYDSTSALPSALSRRLPQPRAAQPPCRASAPEPPAP